jgi:uncharacterized protein YndB with AHSA1/START domain
MSKPQHWVSVDRIINAAAHDLYSAWTVPELMVEWMGGAVEADVRVGGSYRIENEADGKIFFHEGRYLVLEPGRRIAQTFKTGPLDELEGPLPFSDEFIDVTFRALGPTQTFVRLFNGWNGEDMDEEAKQAVKQGWAAWLDELAALF